MRALNIRQGMVRLITSLVTNSILYSYPNFFQKKPMPATMKTGAQTSSTDRNKLKRYTDPKSHSYNNIASSTYHIKKKLVPERSCIRFNSFRRTLELTEIEERLQALENA